MLQSIIVLLSTFALYDVTISLPTPSQTQSTDCINLYKPSNLVPEKPFLNDCKDVSLKNVGTEVRKDNSGQFLCIAYYDALTPLCDMYKNDTSVVFKKYEERRTLYSNNISATCTIFPNISVFVKDYGKTINSLKAASNQHCDLLCGQFGTPPVNPLCSGTVFMNYIFNEETKNKPVINLSSKDLTNVAQTNSVNMETQGLSSPAVLKNAVSNASSSKTTSKLSTAEGTQYENVLDAKTKTSDITADANHPANVPIMPSTPVKEQALKTSSTANVQKTQVSTKVEDKVKVSAVSNIQQSEAPQKTEVNSEKTNDNKQSLLPTSPEEDDKLNIEKLTPITDNSNPAPDTNDEAYTDYTERIPEPRRPSNFDLKQTLVNSNVKQSIPEKPVDTSDNDLHTPYQMQSVDDQDSYFFSYFLFFTIVFVIGYVGYHNKQKIMALLLEGRKGRASRRRPNTASYRKLDSNLEEAVTSSCSANTTNVIY